MTRKCIVFDNDGVNIDSEDVAMRVMDDWGVSFVHQQKPAADLPKDFIYTTYPGTSTNVIVEKLITKFELSLPKIVADHRLAVAPTLEAVGIALADLVTLETNRRFQAELKSVPGTTQALTAIHRMFGSENVALATTSRADRMDISLAHAVDPATGKNAKLAQLFPEGAQRRSGYGHSNKYDEAFGALGWKPAETIVVEDSLSGVTKAKAGRREVAVIGTVAAKFYTDKETQAASLIEAGASIVISSMSDLPKAAEWLRNDMRGPQPAFEAPVFTAPRSPNEIQSKPALNQG